LTAETEYQVMTDMLHKIIFRTTYHWKNGKVKVKSLCGSPPVLPGDPEGIKNPRKKLIMQVHKDRSGSLLVRMKLINVVLMIRGKRVCGQEESVNLAGDNSEETIECY
jgi:hypothetical protein